MPPKKKKQKTRDDRLPYETRRRLDRLVEFLWTAIGTAIPIRDLLRLAAEYIEFPRPLPILKSEERLIENEDDVGDSIAVGVWKGDPVRISFNRSSSLPMATTWWSLPRRSACDSPILSPRYESAFAECINHPTLNYLILLVSSTFGLFVATIYGYNKTLIELEQFDIVTGTSYGRWPFTQIWYAPSSYTIAPLVRIDEDRGIITFSRLNSNSVEISELTVRPIATSKAKDKVVVSEWSTRAEYWIPDGVKIQPWKGGFFGAWRQGVTSEYVIAEVVLQNRAVMQGRPFGQIFTFSHDMTTFTMRDDGACMAAAKVHGFCSFFMFHGEDPVLGTPIGNFTNTTDIQFLPDSNLFLWIDLPNIRVFESQ